MKTTTKTKIIKNNLKKYRQWKFITQQDLANEIKVSLTLIRRIETENHCPKYQIRERLCKYFGIRQEQMFYKSED